MTDQTGSTETDQEIILRLSLDTIVRLTEERDRAREECGHEKAMHRFALAEKDRWIARSLEARQALVATGFWTMDEVGYDIAARIVELDHNAEAMQR